MRPGKVRGTHRSASHGFGSGKLRQLRDAPAQAAFAPWGGVARGAHRLSVSSAIGVRVCRGIPFACAGDAPTVRVGWRGARGGAVGALGGGAAAAYSARSEGRNRVISSGRRGVRRPSQGENPPETPEQNGSCQ